MFAEIRGLILTGGASSRMGKDKAELSYSRLPQWRSLEEILGPLCEEVYWSCTPSQQSSWDIGDRAIVDVVPGHGPASGLHAAFTRTSGGGLASSAWLVVACDYPLLQTRDLQMLIHAREPDAHAVAYFNESKNEIEPMISLWEPPAQARFLESFSLGERSPRRILRSCAVKLIKPRDPSIVCDRDTP